jgi:ribose/xylose/arabinose/galactoside ABC-type transport system permease subunit
MKQIRIFQSNRSLYIILAVIIVFMAVLNPSRFFAIGNFISMAYQIPIIAFLSFGSMIAFLTGGINLAIISTTNFTGIVTILMLRAMVGMEATAEASVFTSVVALAVGLAAALAIGAVCGIFIAYLEIPAFLVTLGVGTLLNGVNILVTKGYTLTGFPQFILDIGNGLLWGIPIPFIIFIVVSLVLSFLLSRTTFGVNLYLVGSNPVAAKYSNIDVRSVYIRQYMLSSLLAALTSFVMMGQLNSVKANYAESYLLVSVLACFLGGVDPNGGFGTTGGMVLSIIILQMVSTGVNLLRLDPYLTQAMWGLIIILLLATNYIRSVAKERKRLGVVLQEVQSNTSHNRKSTR